MCCKSIKITLLLYINRYKKCYKAKSSLNYIIFINFKKEKLCKGKIYYINYQNETIIKYKYI